MAEEEEKPKFDDQQINLKVKDQARAHTPRDSSPPQARASRHTWVVCRLRRT